MNILLVIVGAILFIALVSSVCIACLINNAMKSFNIEIDISLDEISESLYYKC